MSVTKIEEGLYKVRWREGGRARSVLVHGSASLADRVERKKLSIRDENRHLDVKKQINYRMDDLIGRYWDQYGIKKKSADREKRIVEAFVPRWAECLCARWMGWRYRSGTTT